MLLTSEYVSLREMLQRQTGTRIAIYRAWAEYNEDGTWSVYEFDRPTAQLHSAILLSHDTFERAIETLSGLLDEQIPS